MRGRGLHGVQVEGQEVALPEALGRPVLLERHHHLAVHIGLDRGLLRQVQPDRALVGHQVVFGVEGVERPLDDQRLHLAVGIGEGDRRYSITAVGRRPAIDLPRRRQGLAALQELGDEGIARGRHLALGPVGGDDQGVVVDPLGPVLAFRQVEAALDEPGRLGVELAHLDGVLAAIGERDEAIAVGRLQALRALVDPVRALGLGERVDVEDRPPLRRGGPVAGQGGGPPDPADVVGVLPEVAQGPVAFDGDGGDAVLGRGDLQGVGVEAGIARVVLQLRQGPGVLGPGELQRLRALGLFHVGVGIAGRGRGHQECSRQKGRHRAHDHDPQTPLTSKPIEGDMAAKLKTPSHRTLRARSGAGAMLGVCTD